MEPLFFPTADDFRAWLEAHHESEKELWVAFYKKDSGRPSITYPEAVDEALCFGWIDGVRKSLDAISYVNRFTPRKPDSNWSAVNIKRVEDLIARNRMRPAGLRAFEQRRDEKSGVYSYEQRHEAVFSEDYEQQFRANEAAWAYFQAQTNWYRKTATYWVYDAKKEETRLKRLATLIEDSAAGRTVAPLTRPK